MSDARLQTRIQRYGWDAAAAHYHHGWDTQLRPAHDVLLEMARLTPGDDVIETACGTGLITRRIAEAVAPSGTVLATDLSQNMVNALKRRWTAPAHGNIRTARMAAERLEVLDDTFDTAICALGLMYIPTPHAAVRELARVVRPGGVVAATVWGERRNCGWADVFPIVDARVQSDVCPLFFATGAAGALMAEFEQSGLGQLEERRQSETLSFRDAEEVVNAVFCGGPVALAVKRFTESVWKEVKREFMNSIARYRNDDGGYRIPGEFVTVKGVKSDPKAGTTQ